MSIAALGIAFSCFASAATAPAACVWKVTGPNGGTVYLGGSIHALRRQDYPLPEAYLRALKASSRLALEVDEKALEDSTSELVKAGHYPKGDGLSRHIDLRTYAYLKRLFAATGVPEASFERSRPWFLVLVLQSPEGQGLSGNFGVDEFLLKRARAAGKPVVGLESVREHAAVYAGLNDRESEALLDYALTPQRHTANDEDLPWMRAWRTGDADKIAMMMHEAYRGLPAFGERLLGARNRVWLPKIERYLQSGHTYFVVAGAAHFGGPEGVVALLRRDGYQVTQL